jgi:hypothetical protein
MVRGKYLKHYLLAVPILLLYLLLLNSKIPIVSLDFYKPRPSFWDLNNGMLNLWECYKKVGFDLFSLDQATFPNLDSCHNFNYGYFSLVSFGFTQLLNQSVVFWGYVQILVFTLLIVKMYLPEKKIIRIFIMLGALLSPGIFLLFTSGNMDIQIICLLLISAFFIDFKKEKMALILICCTALFKFYTAPVIVIALFLVKEKRSRLFGIVLALTTFSVIAYQMITNPLPPFPNGAQNKFGMGIFDNYIRKTGIQFSELQGQFLGLTLLIICVFLIMYFYKKFNWVSNIPVDFSKKQELQYINFLIMAGTSLTCYIAALNVDYRLTFIALAGISLLQAPQLKVKFVSAIFPYVWLLSLWIVFPGLELKKYIGIDLQPLGDIMMVGTISYFIFQGFYIFKLLKYKSSVIGR